MPSIKCGKCRKELPELASDASSLVEKHLRVPILNVSYKDIDYFIENNRLPENKESSIDNMDFCDLDHLYRYIDMMDDNRDGRWIN